LFEFVSYEDIWVAGIGFDIAGAVLLAKGLLLSPGKILGLSATYAGFNPHEIVARAEDRASTLVGVAALVTGFLLQLTGYLIDLAARSTPPASFTRAAVALTIALIAIVVAVSVYSLTRPWLLRRLLLRIAAHHGLPDRQEHPYGMYLLHFGPLIGEPGPLGHESQAEYAKRVWKVDQIVEGGPHT
jgi:hypothetical protein